jgi:NAD(P)-dependent dehydrogenase (short-subunit alcohol dehydrogenase family)
MNIFVTGCTCRTGAGRSLVERLSADGKVLVTCFVRKEGKADWAIGLKKVSIVYGNLDHLYSLSNYIKKLTW